MLKKIYSILLGILMFLPLLFVAPTLCYYAFNENCEAITSTTNTTQTITQPIYANTNNVSVSSDLVSGNIYHINLPLRTHLNNTSPTYFFYIKPLIQIENYPNLNNDTHIELMANNFGFLRIVQGSSYYWNTEYSLEFDFIFEAFSNDNSSNNINNYGLCNYITSSNYQYVINTSSVTTTTTTTTDNDITSSINVAFTKVFDLPLFSWSKTCPTYSTINNCLTYITGTTSPISYLLNYWVCVGAIGLVGLVVVAIPDYCFKFFF